MQNNMGVTAPIGITRDYYFAYEIGLLLAFGVYWLANYLYPPQLTFSLSEWHEPADYIRPEERGEVLEGTVVHSETTGYEKKGLGKGNAQVNDD